MYIAILMYYTRQNINPYNMITKGLKFTIAFAIFFIVAFIAFNHVLAQTNAPQELQDDAGGAATASEPIRVDEEENNLTEKTEAVEQSAKRTDNNIHIQQFSQTADKITADVKRLKFLSIASFVLAVIALMCCGYGVLRRKD